MRKQKQLLVLLLAIIVPVLVRAQYIFPQKVEGCNTQRFCLDCGNPKANIDNASLASIISEVNKSFKISKSGKGGIMFQVLIDSVGQPCVLSHTDASNNLITRGLIGFINTAKFNPAIENGKAVTSSINLAFVMLNGKLDGRVQRVDQESFSRSFKSSGEPQIFNKAYQYTNSHLSLYLFNSWNKTNSDLPSDLSQHCVTDKYGRLWYSTVLDGLVLFDGNGFTQPTKASIPFARNTQITAMGKDIDENIWISDESSIYKYVNNTWEKFDSIKVGAAGASHIINNTDGSLLFTTDNGVLELKENKWNLLNKDKIVQLPSNRTYGAYRDKHGRLWIGTFKGSIMIDEKGAVTAFNDTETPIKNTCISSITEDDEGNIYCALYAFNITGINKDDEGIAVFTTDGKWIHYNHKNSGLPANTINNLFYDKVEKVLWISTHLAGLVRYDLKNGWENYHNRNSDVPSYDIYQITTGKNGTLYVSTYNGCLQIIRK